MNRLLFIGFIPVGSWALNANQNIRFALNSHHNSRNILYAFISNGIVMYIGKTTKTLHSRMFGYQNPGPTQSTNIKVNEKIKDFLLAKQPVDIFILVDNGLLSYGGFKINLSAGLEDTLIYEVRPKWNYNGKNKLTEDKESEENEKASDPIPEIKTEIATIGKFEIALGQTYFNQGFFNVPVNYSGDFANHGSKIEILLGDTTHSIEGYINRQANKNNTPRILGGTDLKNWLQNNFKLNDTIVVKIISPISIELAKEKNERIT